MRGDRSSQGPGGDLMDAKSWYIDGNVKEVTLKTSSSRRSWRTCLRHPSRTWSGGGDDCQVETAADRKRQDLSCSRVVRENWRLEEK